MRLILAALLVGLSGAALAATTESAGFPRDADSLRTLDSQQLRIVRRAGAQCGGFGTSHYDQITIRHVTTLTAGCQECLTFLRLCTTTIPVVAVGKTMCI